MNTTPTCTEDRVLIGSTTSAVVQGSATRLRRFFGVTADSRSYRNLAYLLIGLPMGTISFSLLVTGVSLGIGTLALALLGVPVLIGCWYLTRGLANVERGVASTLLGDRIPSVSIEAPVGNPWTRLRAMSSDRSRWRELVFVLLRFPLGIATFTSAVALFATSAVVAYAPFYARYDDDRSFGDWTMSERLEDISSSSPWSWLLVPLGGFCFVASLHLTNRLAQACGRLTVAWLGAAPDAPRTISTSDAAHVRVGSSDLLRIHALSFAATMSVLAVIDLVGGGGLWIHWPLITWGAAVACHATLVTRRRQETRSRGDEILQVHEVLFGSTIAMLLMTDLASGGALWFHWPAAIWGTLLIIHEVAARRYDRILRR